MESKREIADVILIVDDNPLNQKVAKRMVEKLGFRARSVWNGKQAVEAVKQESYVAVLMDCQMPEMDGYEATKQIRRWEREIKSHVPILAITASALQGEDERCHAAGMDYFLAKPVEISDLRVALEKVLGTDGDAGVYRRPGPRVAANELVLDDAKLKALRQLGEEGRADFLGEIIELFLEDTPELLAQLSQAIASNDSTAIRQAAQKLRGSCIDLGAKSMGALCAELLERVIRGETEQASALYELLMEEFRKVEARFGKSGAPA